MPTTSTLCPPSAHSVGGTPAPIPLRRRYARFHRITSALLPLSPPSPARSSAPPRRDRVPSRPATALTRYNALAPCNADTLPLHRRHAVLRRPASSTPFPSLPLLRPQLAPRRSRWCRPRRCARAPPSLPTPPLRCTVAATRNVTRPPALLRTNSRPLSLRQSWRLCATPSPPLRVPPPLPSCVPPHCPRIPLHSVTLLASPSPPISPNPRSHHPTPHILLFFLSFHPPVLPSFSPSSFPPSRVLHTDAARGQNDTGSIVVTHGFDNAAWGWYSGLGWGGVIGSYISSTGNRERKPDGTGAAAVAVYASARFLTPHLRVLAVQRVAGNQLGIKNKKFKRQQVWVAGAFLAPSPPEVKDIKIWILFSSLFAAAIPNGVVSNFSSMIIKDMGFSTSKTTVLKSVSDIAQIVVLIVGGVITLNVKNSALVIWQSVGFRVCITFVHRCIPGLILISTSRHSKQSPAPFYQDATPGLLAGYTRCGAPGIDIRMPTGYALFYPTAAERIFPAIFTTRLGSGRQRYCVPTARSEATLLKMCLDDPQLRVPTFRGLYSNTDNFAIVMSYAGTAMPHIFSAPDAQKMEIISILKSLHRNGIHHNNVRAENLMVNPYGVVTLVDFDKAVTT
ncbi:hypothetical protein FB451DRAFT_1560831 [Mycena latifolia]|nr:hypothetical protein FB451DRAFT_1560831 [Mycena latifolia]